MMRPPRFYVENTVITALIDQTERKENGKRKEECILLPELRA